MNDKKMLDLPPYPCTTCLYKTACGDLEHPQSCPFWQRWNQVVTAYGEAYVASVKAGAMREVIGLIESRTAEIKQTSSPATQCPCSACPNQVCLQEPDGHGACFAYCAWKVGIEPELPDRLNMVATILRRRAVEYKQGYEAALPEESHVGPLDSYTAYTIYDTAADMLTAALEGNDQALSRYDY